jgi:hypothetical protein
MLKTQIIRRDMTFNTLQGGLLAGGVAHEHDQNVMNELPESLLPPPTKVSIDRGPWGKVVGQHPPRTTGTNHIQNGIHDATRWCNGGQPNPPNAGTNSAIKDHCSSVRLLG